MKNTSHYSPQEKQADKLWKNYSPKNEEAFWKQYLRLQKKEHSTLLHGNVFFLVLRTLYALGMVIFAYLMATIIAPRYSSNGVSTEQMILTAICPILVWAAYVILSFMFIKINLHGLTISDHILKRRRYFLWKDILQIRFTEADHPNLSIKMVIHTSQGSKHTYTSRITRKKSHRLKQFLSIAPVKISHSDMKVFL